MLRYSLKRDGAGKHSLAREEDDTTLECQCPFDPDGSFCGSWCPLFEIVTGEVNTFVHLHCGNARRLRVRHDANERG